MPVKSETVTAYISPRVVTSETVSITVTPLPLCPYWMLKLYELSIRYGLERLKTNLERLSEERGCSLEMPVESETVTVHIT